MFTINISFSDLNTSSASSVQLFLDDELFSSEMVSDSAGSIYLQFNNSLLSGASTLSVKFLGQGAEAVNVNSIKINNVEQAVTSAHFGSGTSVTSVSLLEMQNRPEDTAYSEPLPGATYSGGSGDDVLLGDDGNNTIYTGTGFDKVYAGAGDDIVYVEGGNKEVNGEDGIDTLNFSLAGNEIFVNLQTGFADYDNDGTHDIRVRTFENITLSSYNDVGYGDDGVNTINAGEGNDILYGGGGNDILNGEAGTDNIRGGAGDDTINGGLEADILRGEVGNDTIYGGNGEDEIFGNAGNDIINGDAGNDRIWGGADNDTILGGSGNDRINGEGGMDAIAGGDGIDYIYGDGDADVLNGNGDSDRIWGGEGDDTIYGGDGNDFLYGENGNDYMYGNDGDDRMYGGNSSDVMEGGAGFDRLWGGEGSDILRGGDGADMLWGEGGNDYLYANEGSAVLSGGLGNDFLYGSEDLDELYGNEGNDTLYGYGGNDLLKGHDGFDVLNAGDGDDTLIWDSGDTFNAGAGFDRLTLAELDTSTIAIFNGVLPRYSGIDVFVLDNFNEQAAANYLNFSVLNIDEISDSGILYITGDDGMDTVTVRNLNQATDYRGIEIIDGVTYERYANTGNELYIEMGLNLDGIGGNGGTIVSGTEGDDVMTGTGADEVLLGLGGNDVLIGGGGNDELSGGDGDDILIFDDVNDIYLGGDGDDTLQMGAGNSTDFDFQSLRHDTGIERIVLNNYGGVGVANAFTINHNLIDEFNATQELYITGDDGLDSVEISNYDFYADFEGNVAIGGVIYEHFYKSSTGNTLYIQRGLNVDGNADGSAGGENFVIGTVDDDVLTGTAGDDIFFAMEGDDIMVYGSGGTDIYQGSEGFDTLQMGSGYGTTFDIDDISSDNQIEHIDLTNVGTDIANVLRVNMNRIDEFNEDSTLYISGGNSDSVDFRNYTLADSFVGNDLFNGTLYEILYRNGNIVYVQRGMNQDGIGDGGIKFISHVAGTSGDDGALYGTAGNELILGLLGDDTIYSNGGTDILDGGSGNDTLVFEDINDTYIGGFGTDTLRLGSGISLGFDLSDILTNKSIEQVALDNLGGAVANNFTMNHNYIDNFSDTNTLYVTGDVGLDTVTVSNLSPGTSFVETVNIGGIDYDHYFRNSNHLYIEQGLLV